MAWAEKYVTAGAAGGGDGTSGNPWTFAEAITNVLAGDCVNMQAGTYPNTTTTRTLSVAGTATAPIWWRGYKTTIGDMDENHDAVAGTDIPSITFTTGQLAISGNNQIFSNLDVTGAFTGGAAGQINCTSVGGTFYNFRAESTAANANGRAITLAAANQGLIGCKLTATTTANQCVRTTGSGTVILGCEVTGGVIGLQLAGSATASVLVFSNVIKGAAGDAIASGQIAYILNNSIYAPTGNGVNITTAVSMLVANNLFVDVNQASKAGINNTTGTNTNLIIPVANGYFNCTANRSGLTEDFTIFDRGTLGSNPFTNAGTGDFSVTTVAKALGFPGLFENVTAYRGWLDLGAVQREEPAAGGGAIFSRIFSGY